MLSSEQWVLLSGRVWWGSQAAMPPLRCRQWCGSQSLTRLQLHAHKVTLEHMPSSGSWVFAEEGTWRMHEPLCAGKDGFTEQLSGRDCALQWLQGWRPGTSVA